jgi:hypothetical protein
MAGGSRSFACRLGAPLQYHHIQRHGFSTERFAEGVPARSARRTARLPHHALEPTLPSPDKEWGRYRSRDMKREAVDLIDHHNGNLASPNISQEVLQGRAIEGGSRESAVVSQASLWASSELNSRSRLCSVDLRV